MLLRAWRDAGTRERLGIVALALFCALGPAVFTVKAILRPEGDPFPVPSAIPAVPVVLLTLGDVMPSDLAGPREAPAMPRLAAWLRESTQFDSCQAAAPGGAPAVEAALRSAFPGGGRGPTLAEELRRLGYVTFGAASRAVARESDLTQGFDVFEEREEGSAAELAALLDRFLGAHAPPRFFAWLDFADARGVVGEDRARSLGDVDRGVGALVDLLNRRRLGGDGIVLLTSDLAYEPATPLPLRNVLAIQFPYGYRAGTRCPTAISSVDLAPTALEVVRGTAPPAWRGRSRRADVQRFQSSGPAVAGPFPRESGSPLWTAEEDGRVLWTNREFAVLAFRDRTGAPVASSPDRWLAAVRAAAR